MFLRQIKILSKLKIKYIKNIGWPLSLSQQEKYKSAHLAKVKESKPKLLLFYFRLKHSSLHRTHICNSYTNEPKQHVRALLLTSRRRTLAADKKFSFIISLSMAQRATGRTFASWQWHQLTGQATDSRLPLLPILALCVCVCRPNQYQ